MTRVTLNQSASAVANSRISQRLITGARRLGLLATVAAAVTLTSAMRAEAAPAPGWSHTVTATAGGHTFLYRWWANACNSDGYEFSPASAGALQEIGTTGVNQFRVTYEWQELNNAGQWETTLNWPVTSGAFPNDSQSYYWQAPFHTFGPLTDPGRLAIKFTFIRPWFQSDYNFTQVVAICS
jgi:hypothetical protein